jgi:HSF-type DNA-binding
MQIYRPYPNQSVRFYFSSQQIPFPFKLHEMLSDAFKDGYETIVSWQPHGKAFRVHNTKEFTETIMQRYFHQTHYKSFQRQLHIYGFHRISSGLDRGSYHHPMFVKGKEMASLRMTRCKIKGPVNEVEAEDPNFYELVETVGSGMVSMARPAQAQSDHLGRQKGSFSSFFSSTGTSATPSRSNDSIALSKAISLPVLVHSRYQHGHGQEGQPQRQYNISCGGRITNMHTMTPIHNTPFGGNGNQIMTTTMMVQDDFRPLPLNRTPPPNRRMSLLEEGDEAFFAGKKFFFVEKPSSHPKCQSSTVESNPALCTHLEHGAE